MNANPNPASGATPKPGVADPNTKSPHDNLKSPLDEATAPGPGKAQSISPKTKSPHD